MIQLAVLEISNVCTQVLMHATAHGDCTDTKGCLWNKESLCESNPFVSTGALQVFHYYYYYCCPLIVITAEDQTILFLPPPLPF